MSENIYVYIKRIKEWAKERRLLDLSTPYKQALKTKEEVEELLMAIVKRDLNEIKDAIGDVFVTLVIVCELLNLDLEDCVAYAYNQIKNRKGKIISGQFVKEV